MSQKIDIIDKFFKFCKESFKEKRFFYFLFLSILTYTQISLYLLLPLMGFYTLTFTWFLLFLFFILGLTVPVKLLEFKYISSWKKNIFKHHKEIFLNSIKIFSAYWSLNEDLTRKQFNSWYKRAKILSLFRYSEIIFSCFYLLLYLKINSDFQILIIHLIINQNLSFLTLFNAALSSFFFFYYILTLVLLFFFYYTEGYINRFRWLINNIFKYKYEELINNKNEIVNFSNLNNDYENIIQNIKDQLSFIKSFENLDFLVILKNPQYNFNFNLILKKFDVDTLRKEYIDYENWINEKFNLNNLKTDEDVQALIYDNNFLNIFIKKAMTMVETQFWDFKETLEMWNVKNDPENVKWKENFCEKVAAFANAKGGIIIIGITNKLPRKIVGVEDLENKMKSINITIKNFTNENEFFKTKELSLENENRIRCSCLMIFIAQTKKVIEIKQRNNVYSYPIRVETGLERLSYSEIQSKKKDIENDNFNFLKNLKVFVN